MENYKRRASDRHNYKKDLFFVAMCIVTLILVCLL